MPSVLLTAFEPYEEWTENSSWLALIELTRWLEDSSHLTTRRYPVCFQAVSKKLGDDLKGDYDLILHLGQAPGTTHIRLESIGLNVDSCGDPLVKGAPTAYQTSLDLPSWQKRLNAAGIPASVSHHAGTVLCNATLFSSQHYLAERRLKSQVAFIHLPLTPAQAAAQTTPLPSMSSAMAAAAIATIIESFEV
ncbi:Pyrrolidone-carboxylate peptidase [Roseimaritima multifibrata]|uniref:Pyrrolidone-carboxylate peptidase n=1 Tax=Roseimaritima multifibrata TaxID=1930274 RepID=A0A517MHD0_9BACT|nr:pyroglutamyl-peptidase I [Roseimaritima multifibrata]QDS94187.1 Pyrrolidone-carboxylate peptidase [Roseimaritima multifibrata]